MADDKIAREIGEVMGAHKLRKDAESSARASEDAAVLDFRRRWPACQREVIAPALNEMQTELASAHCVATVRGLAISIKPPHRQDARLHDDASSDEQPWPSVGFEPDAPVVRVWRSKNGSRIDVGGYSIAQLTADVVKDTVMQLFRALYGSESP